MSTELGRRKMRGWMLAALSGALLASVSGATAFGDDWDGHEGRMKLRSDTFEDGATLPLSMIYNNSSCTVNGVAGGNMSPQLSWKHAPDETRSFVVIAYDVTAEFTHWMMYNIPAGTRSLPENAGTSGSPYGVQTLNDFFSVAEYDGPCPPTNFGPTVHQYVFTVYALDRMLPIIPPPFGGLAGVGPEGLYHQLLGEHGRSHVLASASITGYYSAAAPPGN